VMAGTRRPVIVHTYHGHVLEGYFGAATSRVYRKLERGLAQVSDCLVGVSRATVDDLVRLDIAPRSRFRTIAIGLDLERLAAVDSAAGPAFRREIGAGPDEVLLTCVSRLVPIKRIDVLLRAVAKVRSRGIGVKLAIVGDGPARPELERLSADLGLAEAVRFTGYLLDVRPVLAATDIAVLSSDSEGTPVSLIEAAAVGRPAVATAVGGVADVVHSDCGLLVEAGNPEALASALERLARDAALRAIMGARAREHVLDRFSSRRALADTDRLYGDLMWERAAGVMG
jgi:glycosyltransferase involved in cell wall biosynthesis